MNSDTIDIKLISTEDVLQLLTLSRQTFTETFTAYNIEADLKKYSDFAFTREKLLAEVNHPHSQLYFATFHNQPIGYLKINYAPAQTDLHDENSLEIERIYVLQEYHNKGIGKLLLDKAIIIAKQSDVMYVWLGVWEKSLKAILFYWRNGFVPFATHLFILGDDKQTDILMRLALTHYTQNDSAVIADEQQ